MYLYIGFTHNALINKSKTQKNTMFKNEIIGTTNVCKKEKNIHRRRKLKYTWARTSCSRSIT